MPFVTFASVLFFFPYLTNYESFSNGISISLWQTPIYSYIGIHSLFLFLIVTYLVINLKENINVGIASSLGTFGNYLAVASSNIRNIMVLSLFFASCITLMIYGYTTTLFLMVLSMKLLSMNPRPPVINTFRCWWFPDAIIRRLLDFRTRWNRVET